MSISLSSRLGHTLTQALTAVTLAAAFSGAAQAAVVWNTYGAGYQQGYLGNGAANHTNAQVFTLSQATTLTDFAWSGVYNNNQLGANESFVIDIYASASGNPSNTPVASLTAGAANRTASGTKLFSFYDVYDYAFEPQAALALSAGDYFFSVNSSASNWFWGVTSTGTGGFFVRDNLGAWQERTSTLAFRIEGNTVPEPASLALVGISLAGLLAARRRSA